MAGEENFLPAAWFGGRGRMRWRLELDFKGWMEKLARDGGGGGTVDYGRAVAQPRQAEGAMSTWTAVLVS